MKTKIAMILILSLVAGSAFADGRGTAGAARGGAEGANGAGVARLGFFPGWQTASPAQVEAALSGLPKEQTAKSAPAVWPSWVHLAKAE